MTTTTTNTFAKGDTVTIDPLVARSRHIGVVYEIDETPGGRRTRYRIKDPNNGALINIPGDCLVAAPSGVPAPNAFVTKFAPYVPVPPVGTIVRIKGVRNIDPKDVYVVIGETPKGAKIALLGGNGRYYTGAAAKYLVPVSMDDVIVG